MARINGGISGLVALVVGGESLSTEELDHLGCNESITHSDMMISSEEVNVIGVSKGDEIPLLTEGSWVV